jgi:hypothetical protein
MCLPNDHFLVVPGGCGFSFSIFFIFLSHALEQTYRDISSINQ